VSAPRTVGSLCTGYGGLELAAAELFGPLKALWYAEYDPTSKLPGDRQPAARVCAERHPDTPNIGDIEAITAAGRWSTLPRVDVLCAGYPCQGESDAGLRRGADDPRFRWPDVHAAIRALRPRLVLLENVRGHLNRSFPRVVADLAAIGYVGRWRCVRASDVGAPHRRNRLYAAAWPADAGPPPTRATAPARDTATDVELLPTPRAGDAIRGSDPNRVARAGANQGRASGTGRSLVDALLPTPTTRDHKGAGWGDQPGRPLSETIMRLLPTPTAERTGHNQGGAAGRVGPERPSLDQIGKLLPTPKASDGEKGGPNQRGSSGDLALPAVAASLLPTPTVADSRNTRNATAGRTTGSNHNAGWTLSDVAHAERWGQYATAITRWETTLGRPAPDPTVTGRNGRPQLSPLFVEWMMGLPDGWVTAVIDHRGQALKVLGNGVVPQAAAHAYRLILGEQQQPGLFEVGLSGETS
jgi:DNA (cytosine-5)-methyltransferase 1